MPTPSPIGPERRGRRVRVELPPKVRAIVIFGGQSAEHDVSRVSAANLVAALDPDRYDVTTIAIGRDGAWRMIGPPGSPPAVPTGADGGADLGGLPTVGTSVPAGQIIDVVRATPATSPDAGDDTTAESPLVVIPVLHGPNGEDGTIQGLLELAGVAYVGSGVLGSAVSMDKVMTKTVLDAAGIPQARWRSAYGWEIDDALVADIAADLGYPIFVKPANMGSSVGVSKATDTDGLLAAIEIALEHDELVVFEETIVGRELEIAVLGNDEPKASVPGEIIPAADFYDYDDKYRDGAAKTVIPAELPPGAADEMAALAIRTFRALRAEGLARVDMFYDEGGRGFVLNEINTFPGFTPISMFPMMWAASGLAYSQLVDEMVRLALERHERRAR